jgi:hypothetical protein
MTEGTRESADYAYEVGQGKRRPKRRPNVSKAVSEGLEREPKSTASRAALSRQTKRAASRRTGRTLGCGEEGRQNASPPSLISTDGLTHQRR